MFNFKTIPKHSFSDGSPFWYVSSREYGYINEETGQINIPYDNLTFTDCEVVPGITVNNNIGDVIFGVNENEITWNGSDLMTEERVREIFREEYYNILREDIENGV